MKKTIVIILVLVLAVFVGFRVYQYYFQSSDQSHFTREVVPVAVEGGRGVD